MQNLADGTLKKNFPFESLSTDPDRREVSYLEAVGRTLCGIAPWLELGADETEEGQQRAVMIGLTLRGLKNADFLKTQQTRNGRYAEQQERMISPEGSYPVIGLPVTDAFWANPYADWTSRKAWNNIEVAADHSIQ